MQSAEKLFPAVSHFHRNRFFFYGLHLRADCEMINTVYGCFTFRFIPFAAGGCVTVRVVGIAAGGCVTVWLVGIAAGGCVTVGVAGIAAGGCVTVGVAGIAVDIL